MGRFLVGTPWGEPDIPFVLIVLTVFFYIFFPSHLVSQERGVLGLLYHGQSLRVKTTDYTPGLHFKLHYLDLSQEFTPNKHQSEMNTYELYNALPLYNCTFTSF